MAQEPTLKQRIQETLAKILDVRQRINSRLAAVDLLQVELQQYRQELKDEILELSPALAGEIFSTWPT